MKTIIAKQSKPSEERIHDMKFDPAGNFDCYCNNIYRHNVVTVKN
jgi:hypothetical protein